LKEVEEMKYNYEVEKGEALARLKMKTESKILEINNQLKAMRDAVTDQLALIELYGYRETVKCHKGCGGVIQQATQKAKKLEHKNEATKTELEKEKVKLEFDLESLNELLTPGHCNL